MQWLGSVSPSPLYRNRRNALVDRRKVSLSPTLTRRELKLNIGQLLIIGFDGTAWVGHVSALGTLYKVVSAAS